MSHPLDVLGPLGGFPTPLHGGNPGDRGCNGCVDCCHLPEKSVTDEEAERLRALHARLDDPSGPLVISEDPRRPGWHIMHGACAFRREDTPLHAGGCRIYDDRPGMCAVFTCSFLLNARRTRY